MTVLRWTVALVIFVIAGILIIARSTEAARKMPRTAQFLLRLVGIVVACVGVYVAPLQYGHSSNASASVPANTTSHAQATNSPSKVENSTLVDSTSSANQATNSTSTTSDNQTEDVKATKALTQYMHDNFGTPGYATAWSSAVKKYEVYDSADGKTVNVYTSIYPDADGKQTANDIANSVLFNLSSVSVHDVTVYGLNNTPLAYKSK